MTIKEYNEKWCRLKDDATIFLTRYDHALSKCNDYKGAKQQLELLGFDDELVEYLKNAVSYYHSLKNDEMRQDKNNGIGYKEFTKEEHDEIYRRLLKVLKEKGNTLDEEVVKYKHWCFTHNNQTVDWNLFDDMIDGFKKVEI